MRKISLILVCLMFTAFAYAQSVQLRFVNNQFGIQTSFFNDTIFLNDSIYNAGVQPFTGSVYTGCRINSTVLPLPSGGIIDSLIVQNAVLDTNNNPVGFTLRVKISPQYFNVGPNVVVIWPIYNGMPTTISDSLHLNVIATYHTGIEESPASRIYLYQIGDRLNINMGERETTVKQVRIFDILGKSVYTNRAPDSRQIEVGDWNKGIYICDFLYDSGEHKTIKIRIE
jgi:hypothetical protein